MVRVMVGVASAIALFSVSAQAQQDAVAKPADTKKICKAVGPPTGSILGAKKECHTKAEWTAINKQNEDNVDRFRNRASGMSNPGSGF